MRHSLIRAFAASAAMLIISPSVHAEGLLDMIFGRHEQPAEAPAPSTNKIVLPNYAAPHETKPRRPNRPRFMHIHPGKPRLSEETKFLSSAAFSRRFAIAGENASKETQDAIDYMMEHDKTLKRGDALVTQTGIVIFDPDWNLNGMFLPPDHENVAKPVHDRLIAFTRPMTPAPADQPAAAASDPEPDTAVPVAAEPPADATTNTPDGRSIRFVGGALPQEDIVAPPKNRAVFFNNRD